MKCPKCEVEMQSGYLQTGNLIAFNKQRHKISINPKDPEDGHGKHFFLMILQDISANNVV